MATKKNVGAIPTENVIEEANNVADENAALRKQVEAQSAQIAQLMEQMQQMTMLMAQQASASAAVNKPKNDGRMIEFINLVEGTLLLRGSANKIWSIEGQFTKRSFTEREAAIIVSNMANLINNGAVYITDDQFIEDYNLTDTFRYILSDKVLKTLLEQDAKKVIRVYESASDLQKRTIVDMIAKRLESGEEVDANIVKKISKMCGKNLFDLAPEEDEDEE